MNLESRIDSLKAKHAALESEIEAETQRPAPDEVHLHTLKRQKLRIKEELEHLHVN